MRKKKVIGGMLAICLMAVMAGTGYQYMKSEKAKGIKVIGVLDGDTVTLEGKVRFRLRSIDAAEADLCGGKEAKAELEKLLTNKRVRVEEEILDNWGRPMGLLYAGDKLINLEMIKSGWVKYHHDQTSVAEKLKEVGDKNKADNKGLYGKCWQRENRQNQKCNIKGNIDPSNSRLKRFYVPGCVQYETTIVELDRGEEWFCSENEAIKAGYVKSERCPP
ncbi:MAG: thermonuclease family protein [Candidatus Shapirobacteria bacterium]|jgi:endonuclease YncB( thermonuclease family)